MNLEKSNRNSCCAINQNNTIDSKLIKTKETDYNSNFAFHGDFDDLVNAITNKDFNSMSHLLHDNGEFEIQDDSFETIVVQKSEFLSWFFAALSITEIVSIVQDQCLNCKFGNPVLLINEGHFPKRISSPADPIYTGLMYEIEEGKITRISFCYSFIGKENISQFQININKIMELEKRGVSKEDAFFQVLGYNYNKNDF